MWALRDVSLDVPQGAGLGIIGRNGAGKTTLLKLVSRVTWPTQRHRCGSAGHVVSLIELGAGFHPELTGRENVYLGAGLFGLTRRETDRRFDEIVDFADVGVADRYADEALLLGAVRATGLRRRHLQPARHRPGGRSARGRRRAVPPAGHRGAEAADRRRQDGAVHLARSVERPASVHATSSGSTKARCARTVRPRRSPSGT